MGVGLSGPRARPAEGQRAKPRPHPPGKAPPARRLPSTPLLAALLCTFGKHRRLSVAVGHSPLGDLNVLSHRVLTVTA